MALKPAINLFCEAGSIVDIGWWEEDDGWYGTAYRWQITLNVQPQFHGSIETPNYQYYDGMDVRTGMWIASLASGSICKIINIISQDTSTVVAEIEDVERTNILSDPAFTGFGGIPDGMALIFALNANGEPVWGNLAYSSTILTTNYAFFTDIDAKFRFRNQVKNYIPVTQIGHSFLVGDIIQLNEDGSYALAIADTPNNINKVIGIVSDVGTPSVNSFNFRPIGEYVTNLNLTNIGVPGSILYLDATTPGTLTATKPVLAKPIYFKINDTTAVVLTELNEQTGGATSIMFHDDLSNQVNGSDTIFTVTKGNYIAGSLSVSIGGVINDKDIHYFEENPATGRVRFIVPPTENDKPIIAQYQYV